MIKSILGLSTQLETDQTFDELKEIYKHKIGNIYYKGNIAHNYISLFYRPYDPNFLIPKLSIRSLHGPRHQFIIDKDNIRDGKQVIIFQIATYMRIMIYLGVIMTISVTTVLAFREDTITPVVIALIIFIASYFYHKLVFKNQLDQFKSDLEKFTDDFRSNAS
jgi:hypothetical protein